MEAASVAGRRVGRGPVAPDSAGGAAGTRTNSCRGTVAGTEGVAIREATPTHQGKAVRSNARWSMFFYIDAVRFFKTTLTLATSHSESDSSHPYWLSFLGPHFLHP